MTILVLILLIAESIAIMILLEGNTVALNKGILRFFASFSLGIGFTTLAQALLKKGIKDK